MTVKELLKYVVCNVEVWKPIEGVKIWNFDRRCIKKVFDRRCIKKVDLNEYNDAEVYNYKFFTKNEYLEYLADTYFDEEIYEAIYGYEPVLVVIVKPE